MEWVQQNVLYTGINIFLSLSLSPLANDITTCLCHKLLDEKCSISRSLMKLTTQLSIQMIRNECRSLIICLALQERQLKTIFLHNIHRCIIENSLDEKTSLSTACGIYVQRIHRYQVCIKFKEKMIPVLRLAR